MRSHEKHDKGEPNELLTLNPSYNISGKIFSDEQYSYRLIVVVYYATSRTASARGPNDAKGMVKKLLTILHRRRVVVIESQKI